MRDKLRVIFIGDIVGKGGRRIVKELVPSLKSRYEPDLVIANGENAANGKGLTPKITKELLNSGIDIMTSGNHIWNKPEIFDYLNETKVLIRPNNYPEGVPGKGFTTIEIDDYGKVGIVNTQGRVFMQSIDCPFRKTEDELSTLKDCNAIIVDFHGEATSEKKTFARYFSGRVSAVLGTHTHVQTTDCDILNGTAYISDVGMTGAFNSIIGMKYETVIDRFLKAIPTRFEVADEDLRMDFVMLDITDGHTEKITVFEYDIMGNKVVEISKGA
ncbi:TIGR00282 family metallophosphoesterase [candidate division TA06 bacterium]|uniref:TIGR00282 family metallophosphoesterase n=1 Tax=candidate division TA06 bacterium TaxID=2250710 RepID=A0A660SD94_UNCT6|nr:MAG: TIGR00282 family metallophosphoesterase [candidate division TA06 bacterium]